MKIVTGHNADDIAETVIMNILRFIVKLLLFSCFNSLLIHSYRFWIRNGLNMDPDSAFKVNADPDSAPGFFITKILRKFEKKFQILGPKCL